MSICPEPEGPVIATNSPDLPPGSKLLQDVGATCLALKDAVHVADVDDGAHYAGNT